MIHREASCYQLAFLFYKSYQFYKSLQFYALFGVKNSFFILQSVVSFSPAPLHKTTDRESVIDGRWQKVIFKPVPSELLRSFFGLTSELARNYTKKIRCRSVINLIRIPRKYRQILV